eukprot:97844-Amorphochlora_amoeboformis.AAC.2
MPGGRGVAISRKARRAEGCTTGLVAGVLWLAVSNLFASSFGLSVRYLPSSDTDRTARTLFS